MSTYIYASKQPRRATLPCPWRIAWPSARLRERPRQARSKTCATAPAFEPAGN